MPEVPFALIESRENPVILNVIEVSDKNCRDENGRFDSQAGVQYLRNLFRDSSALWQRAAYQGGGFGPFPAPGDTFDFRRTRFIAAPFRD